MRGFAVRHLASDVHHARRYASKVTGLNGARSCFAFCKLLGIETSRAKASRALVAYWREHRLEPSAKTKTRKKPTNAVVKPAMSEPKPAVISAPSVNSDDFLRSYDWRRVRMEALKRYGPRCQCCGATPASGAIMNVDHIRPRRLFPELALDIENLQVLCSDCNHGKGNWDMTDWRPKPEKAE